MPQAKNPPRGAVLESVLRGVTFLQRPCQVAVKTF
jgi:hypothetical protein